MTIIAPPPVETTTQSPLGEVVPMTRLRLGPSPLNRRRWQNFKANRRGYWSFWIFLILFFVSLFAELIGNFHQPVPEPAAGVDHVAARAQRVDPLEQLRAGHVELVAEHRAGNEVIGALEQETEHDRVLVEIGPVPLAGGHGRGHV